MANIVRSDLAVASGCDLTSTYDVSRQEAPGKLWRCDDGGQFRVEFTESGVAYGESVETKTKLEYWFDIEEGRSAPRCITNVELLQQPALMWGVNFPGSLKLSVAGREDAAVVYLPGVRMYDPTGRTGT